MDNVRGRVLVCSLDVCGDMEVVLRFSSYMVFVTKPAPTGDSTHRDDLHSARHLVGVMEAAPLTANVHHIGHISCTGCWIEPLKALKSSKSFHGFNDFNDFDDLDDIIQYLVRNLQYP